MSTIWKILHCRLTLVWINPIVEVCRGILFHLLITSGHWAPLLCLILAQSPPCCCSCGAACDLDATLHLFLLYLGLNSPQLFSRLCYLENCRLARVFITDFLFFKSFPPVPAFTNLLLCRRCINRAPFVAVDRRSDLRGGFNYRCIKTCYGHGSLLTYKFTQSCFAGCRLNFPFGHCKTSSTSTNLCHLKKGKQQQRFGLCKCRYVTVATYRQGK